MLSKTATPARGFLVTLGMLAAATAGAAQTTPTPSPYPPAPYTGPVNASHYHQAPPFQWGWFGAERFSRPVGWARNYQGALIRWSHQRRY